MKFVITKQEAEEAIRSHFEISREFPIEILDDADENKKIRKLFIKNVEYLLERGKKILGIKYIREITGWSLFDSKEFSENATSRTLFMDSSTVLKRDEVESYFSKAISTF